MSEEEKKAVVESFEGVPKDQGSDNDASPVLPDHNTENSVEALGSGSDVGSDIEPPAQSNIANDTVDKVSNEATAESVSDLSASQSSEEHDPVADGQELDNEIRADDPVKPGPSRDELLKSINALLPLILTSYTREDVETIIEGFNTFLKDQPDNYLAERKITEQLKDFELDTVGGWYLLERGLPGEIKINHSKIPAEPQKQSEATPVENAGDFDFSDVNPSNEPPQFDSDYEENPQLASLADMGFGPEEQSNSSEDPAKNIVSRAGSTLAATASAEPGSGQAAAPTPPSGPSPSPGLDKTKQTDEAADRLSQVNEEGKNKASNVIGGENDPDSRVEKTQMVSGGSYGWLGGAVASVVDAVRKGQDRKLARIDNLELRSMEENSAIVDGKMEKLKSLADGLKALPPTIPSDQKNALLDTFSKFSEDVSKSVHAESQAGLTRVRSGKTTSGALKKHLESREEEYSSIMDDAKSSPVAQSDPSFSDRLVQIKDNTAEKIRQMMEKLMQLIENFAFGKRSGPRP
jgi:hypothetical protein